MAKYLTHEDYLMPLPADQRAALQEVSARIIARMPDLEPCISYAAPAYRLPGGRPSDIVAGFAAFKDHLGYYAYSGTVVPRLAARLKQAGFKSTKSGVTFQPDRGKAALPRYGTVHPGYRRGLTRQY
ncbi:MAG: hypothetical protein P8X50_03780 [Maritimibacter sp.]